MAFPTHIVAVGGIVEDEHGNILLVKTRDGGWVSKEKVLDFITAPTAPAIRTRFQVYLDFGGATAYMEYVTKPEFEIKHRTGISRR